MPSMSGRSSPLPSFTPPRHPPSPSSGLVTALTALASSSGAVAEKHSLSTRSRSRSVVAGEGWSIPRRFADAFQPLRVGGAATAGGRAITIPVFRFLHPGRDAGRSSLRKDGRVSYNQTGTAYGRRGVLVAVSGTIGGIALVMLLLLALIRPLLPSRHSLPFTGDPDTLIYTRTEVERVWLWEIASGRYPSRRKTDFELGDVRARVYRAGATVEPVHANPGVPRPVQGERATSDPLLAAARTGYERRAGAVLLPDPTLAAIGPPRETLAIRARTAYSPHSRAPPPSSFPPRPVPNSAIDLDVVMDHCDFSEGKYVRDCLEVLRQNAGMDTGLRRGDAEGWRATFVPGAADGVTAPRATTTTLDLTTGDMTQVLNSSSFASLLAARQARTLAPPQHAPHPTHPTADPHCDPDYPRIFHIFWAGPFTDKPYSAALSFLYTQRLGLDRALDHSYRDSPICRPQLWIWINPGPASSLPDPNARRTMYSELSANPWSSPLLHRRFSDSVKFKLWNTTEQLDAVSEMKGWREMRLFNSGGVKYGAVGEKKAAPTVTVKKEITLDKDGLPPAAEVTGESDTSEDMIAEAELGRFGNDTAAGALSRDAVVLANTTTNATVPLTAPRKAKDELFERIGSTSSNGYDRLSVVLSDMARFVLTHRFGGVYLDADTILLRDWEELWGWHGAFAYRWSRMKKYNTAVLKMQRGSALGNFIFRTAVANGLDFHPMTISRYTLDAKMEGLLLRLPDALFDPAWLNTEYYQRDRPPAPYFKRFEDFFDTPKEISAAPIAQGFDGFFKGAFSYHFHNFWWIPFDPHRNFPDLGPRFVAGERIARGRLHAAKLAATPPPPVLVPTSTSKSTVAVGGKKAAGPTLAMLPVEKVYQWGDDESDYDELDWSHERIEDDDEDIGWAAVLKRTFESFVRGERPNLYGEWIDFGAEEAE